MPEYIEKILVAFALGVLAILVLFGIVWLSVIVTEPANAEEYDPAAAIQTVAYQPTVSHASSVGDTCGTYDRLLRREANKYDNSTALLELARVIIDIESKCNPRAHSRAHARGLMQLMPATARAMGYRGRASGLYDPATNIRLGMRYLDMCMTRAQGNYQRAGACYNGGPRRTNYSYRNLPRETRGYVRKIAALTRQRHRSNIVQA